MAKSSATQPPETTDRPSRQSGNTIWDWLVVLFRLLLLGVGGGIATLVGVAIAQLYPSTQTQEPPLLEKAIRGTQSLVTDLQRLPQRFQGEPSPIVSPAASPSPTANSPAAPSSPQATATPPSPLSATDRQQLQTELTQIRADLQTLNSRATTLESQASAATTPADRQRLQTELTQIETQLQTLNDRAVALESQVGTTNSAASLEERLRGLEERLETGPTSSGFNEAPMLAPTAAVTQGDVLMVTLPSDALFDPNQSVLRPGTTAILDNIVGDLQRYSGATIRVAAHTDQQDSAANDRARSFEQAKAIERYLSQKLGDGYQWVVLGYGHSQPVSGDTPIDPQRNRRIEIIIDPR